MFLPSVHLRSGTEEHGTWVSSLYIPQWNSEEGTYILHYVMVVDRLGGTVYFDAVTFPPGFAIKYERF